MLLQALALISSSLSVTTSTLLINYSAPAATSEFGSCQLEGSFLGDKISCPGNDSIYIKPSTDPKGQAALHYHREPEFRRAEVKGAGTYAADKTYFVGYEFSLANYNEHLAIFQWKNGASDKNDNQDIVFNLQWTETQPTRLSLGYTPPGVGEKYKPLWTDSSNFTTDTTHNIALAWDTKSGGNNNLQVWLDGKSVLNKGGLSLWTGEVYPKFGIYRGEEGDHDTAGESHVYDLYVYKVQLSDASMDEVSGASGLNKTSTR